MTIYCTAHPAVRDLVHDFMGREQSRDLTDADQMLHDMIVEHVERAAEEAASKMPDAVLTTHFDVRSLVEEYFWRGRQGDYCPRQRAQVLHDMIVQHVEEVVTKIEKDADDAVERAELKTSAACDRAWSAVCQSRVEECAAIDALRASAPHHPLVAYFDRVTEMVDEWG